MLLLSTNFDVAHQVLGQFSGKDLGCGLFFIKKTAVRQSSKNHFTKIARKYFYGDINRNNVYQSIYLQELESWRTTFTIIQLDSVQLEWFSNERTIHEYLQSRPPFTWSTCFVWRNLSPSWWPQLEVPSPEFAADPDISQLCSLFSMEWLHCEQSPKCSFLCHDLRGLA